MTKPFRIFIAYSRKDARFLEELKVHFAPLERSNQVEIWYDGEIEPGEEWEQAIKNQIEIANIILLLISADSIASDFFYEKEFKNALNKHEKGTAKVIPMILRPCAWEAITSLAKLQVVPKNGIPVTNWSTHDEPYSFMVKGILQILKNYEKKEEQYKETARIAAIESEKEQAERNRKEAIKHQKGEQQDSNGIEQKLTQQRKLKIGINDRDECFFILDLPDLGYINKEYRNNDVRNVFGRLLSYAYAKKKDKPHMLPDKRKYSQYNNNFVFELNRICSIKLKRDDILKKTIDKRFELRIDKENIFIEREDKILEIHELKIRLVPENKP